MLVKHDDGFGNLDARERENSHKASESKNKTHTHNRIIIIITQKRKRKKNCYALPTQHSNIGTTYIHNI